jgi:hypothetical protein
MPPGSRAGGLALFGLREKQSLSVGDLHSVKTEQHRQSTRWRQAFTEIKPILYGLHGL